MKYDFNNSYKWLYCCLSKKRRRAQELMKTASHLAYYWQRICYQWNVNMTVVWLLWLLQTELLMKLLSCGSVVTELKVLSCVRLWDVCGASGLTGLVLPYIYELACLFQYFITVWFYCWQFASIRYLAIFRIFTVLTDWKKHQNTDPKWKTFFLLKTAT